MAGEDDKVRGFGIEAARAEDVDAIVALERAVEHAPRWQREVYFEMVQGMGASADNELKRYIAVARETDGRMVGFSAGSLHPALPDSAVLESVAVAPRARRGGVGRALCEAVIAWCRSEGAEAIGLEVRRKSAGAIALYRSMGFVEAGVRPAYYADPADEAAVMRIDFAML